MTPRVALIAIIPMPPQVQRRKAHLRTFCSECERLQDRLNAATDLIVEIVNERFGNLREQSRQLRRAEEMRNDVMLSYLEHLKTHKHLIAA